VSFIEIYRQQVKQFFVILEEKNLLLSKIPSVKYSDNELKTINLHHRQIRTGITKLIERTNRIVDENFNETEFSEFLILLRAYEFVIHLEYIKDILIEMLNKEKFPENIENKPLGSVIKKINEQLYPHSSNSSEEKSGKELRKLNYELFFVDFRNAIIHRKYKLDNMELFYNDYQGEQIKINSDKFKEMISKLILLEVHTIGKYSELVT